MPPGDPTTRRGVTFHEAHVPRAFLSPARGLEGSRAGGKAGVILPQPSHGGAAAAKVRKKWSPADCWSQTSWISIPYLDRMNLWLRRYSLVRVAVDFTSSTTSLPPKR